MTKLNIKVSRATSRWLKSQPDYTVEYAGEVLTTLVNQVELRWDDVSCMTPESLVCYCMDFAGVESMEQLNKRADHFCWCNGFIGYKLQSRFWKNFSKISKITLDFSKSW